jgi:GWxTD domain-containing protein
MQSDRARLSQVFRGLSLILVMALAAGVAHADQNKNKKEKLSKYYSEWLNRDVAYIITKQERKDFLQLPTDAARDSFIKRFWDIRNPTPGSPINTYKDEIYQRIAYADAHYGVGSGGEGWRSDRGRTYITLGAPQQVQKYYGAPNLLPIEIWFYSNADDPALPPFFYVLFYQRDNIGDFRYYSPYMDGPDKLVTGTEAVNDPQSALKLIQSSVGSEVARVAQTLIPGEPLDPNGRIGLQSDVMLGILRNLANQPSHIDELNRRREMIETVTSRMIVDAKTLDIVMLPLRDARGVTRLDYALRLRNPGDLTFTQGPDGRYSYALEVRVRVFGPDKKLIFTQEKSVTDKFGGRRMEEIKDRPFAYEGILPLSPGKYHLDFLLTDWTQKVGYHTERDVEIPANSANTFLIPAILPFSAAEGADRSKDGTIPFAIAGVKFKPLEAPLIFRKEQDLNIAYQIWAPPRDPKADAGQNLVVQYALGRPALPGSPTVVKDTVDMGEFTSSGSLVDGKKFSLADDPEGNYILTVSISNPGSSQKTFSSMSFQILNEVAVNPSWDVDEPGIEADETKGLLDQQRALCFLAQGKPTEARLWFRLALAKNHGDDIARSRLVQAYYTLNAYSAVVSLFNDAGVTENTDSGTLTQIAESLVKTGTPAKAVSLLEDAIHARPEDGPLYLALADCYQQVGNHRQAEEMSLKGRSLLGTASPK